MDPTSNWNELFQRLSKEITVIPLSPSQACDHNRVESEYFNHVVNPSKVLQQPSQISKPSDSTGASVMSLPLVFPLDPPSGLPSLPRLLPLYSGSHFVPHLTRNLANEGDASSSSDQNANSFVGAAEPRRESSKVHHESRSQPRANIYVGEGGKTMFSCTKCDLQFESATLFQEHWKTHVNERPYKCDECGIALKRKEHLDRHRSAHTSERPHQCPQCDKRFKRSEHLTRHVITHAEVKPFVCPQCLKGFSRKDHLNKHSATHCIRNEAEDEQRKYFSEMQSWDQDLARRMETDHNPVIREFHDMLQHVGAFRDCSNVKVEVDS